MGGPVRAAAVGRPSLAPSVSPLPKGSRRPVSWDTLTGPPTGPWKGCAHVMTRSPKCRGVRVRACGYVCCKDRCTLKTRGFILLVVSSS